jgi:hypothetical protein
MADVSAIQEPEQKSADQESIDLLIALPAPLTGDALTSTVAKLAQARQLLPTPFATALAFPGEPNPDGSPPSPEHSELAGHGLRFATYPPPAAEPGSIPWLTNAAAYRPISALAGQLGARACTILGTDLSLNGDALTPERLALLLDPVLEGSFDLAMPIYTIEAFDGLVNKSILYPLTRALYGFRVAYPLGNEFQISSKLFPAMANSGTRDPSRQQGRLPWPATLAASRNLKICQVRVGRRRTSAADGIELADALAQLVGPLFVDMEDHAALWQRVRGSHEVPAFGPLDAPLVESTKEVDARHMLEAFQIGVANLREVWSLILPPVTLLELRKLSRLTVENFQMEDALWARIVYDFALAHRLRNIHRGHLFGALTPLYLGWAASYAVAVNKNGIVAAQERIERLARTYEAEKPYLLSRWRWPDRFHP